MTEQTNGKPSRRPSVLVIAHRIDRDGQGMERLHARLAEALSARFDIHVLVGAIDEVTARSVTVHKIPLLERPIPLRFMMFAVFASLRLLVLGKKMSLRHSCGAIVFNRVDLVSVHLCQAAVVNANGGRTMPSSGSLARRLNTGLLKTLALHLERLAFTPQRRTTAAAVSEPGLDEVAKFYRATPRVLTENGVDGEAFGFHPTRRAEVRRQFALSDDEFVALLVGGDWTLRGVDLAIRALTDLPKNVKLLIAGRGDRRSMEELSSSLHVAERVVFLGRRNDLADLYQAADVLLQLSSYETFSLVLVEAALSHLALVTTKVGVAETLCGDDDSGGIIINRSVQDVAAGLNNARGDREQARKRAEVALHRAKRFTLTHMSEQLEVAYKEILSQS
jgi:UDP-glucose:(heptosyl)LPS alpha-1,3-glucosyltransferase